MEEIHDDPIISNEVDPSEGSSQLSISVSSLRLIDGGSAGSRETVPSYSDKPGSYKSSENCDKFPDHTKHKEDMEIQKTNLLCRFKTVSKEWLNFLGRVPPSCHSTQLLMAFLTPLSVSCLNRSDAITSCNGLLGCQGRLGDNAYYICNPVTEDWRTVPQPNLYHGPNNSHSTCL
uniref:Uncharacterized protein n=1 Tax=Salix viminalis TaxID=40686 RepID=A0A6N2NAA5_SALVM